MGRNKTVTDLEVLDAARHVFREQGHAASTRDIARAAGISQAVLYQRFSSKDELFFRAMLPEVPDVQAFVGAYSPQNAFDDLVAIAERLAAYLRTFMPILLKVLAVPDVQIERLQAWHEQLPFIPIADALTERFRRLNADGLTGGGDPHAYAVSLMSLVHSLAFFEILTSHQVRDQRQANVRAMMSILWKGLEPRRAS
jgi:AcrR family transcriptional regulator